MTSSLRHLFGAIAYRRRWQAALLLLLMIVAGVFEVLTLGSLVPFLALVTSTGAREVQAARAYLGLATAPMAELVVLAAFVFGLCALSAALIRVTLAWGTQKFVFRLGFDLEVKAYEASLMRPYAEQVRSNSAETISSLDKVGAISSTVFLPILMAVSSGVITVFILAALIAIRPVDAVIALTGFVLAYLGVSLVFRGRLTSSSRTVASAQRRRVQALQEGLGGIRDIILDDTQSLYAQRFAQIDLDLRDAQSSIGVIGAAPRFAIEGAGMIVIAGLVVWLSGQPGGVPGAVPLLGALALAAQRLLPLLQQIYNSWSQVAGNRQTLLDVASLLGSGEAQRTATAASASPSPPLRFQRSLILEDVSFRYADRDAPVLDRLTLQIDKGARVGLIGRSGGGKSTAMDIALGLLTPDSGRVAVDGVTLDGPLRMQWRRMVAHVPQSIYLADAGILENIAFGSTLGDIDEDRVREAARRSDLHDFIQRLPKGYDTMVGERGVQLSGGQRQRIGVARALYKRSTVLIFDEATSALDETTENAVLDSIAALDRGLTILMVAHRLRTLRGCDVIHRMEEGRIVEHGAYADFAKVA
ncbi:ABC transporter ATP-binding protein [soil metagenome]